MFWGRFSPSRHSGLLFGNIVQALLLTDIIEAIYISLVPEDKLARQYFFHNSTFQKPMWTEVAEERGSKVTCYYYSTNMEGAIFPGHVPAFYGISLMRWNNFYVWDQCHEEFFRQYLPSANYVRVGYIDMFDDGSVIPESASTFKIAVFDVFPLRRTLLASLGCSDELEYYTERIFKKFSLDIAHLAKNVTSVTILYKQKREGNKERISVKKSCFEEISS